jgi:zinc transport system substrate-binding protein
LWQRGRDTSSVVPAPETKLSIVATFYPLQDFAESVVGDAASVKSIVPAGTEPHDYEPTPQDIVSIYQADVFLLNGGGIDAWAEKLLPELKRRGVTIVQMSEVVSVLPEADAEGREQESFDPHFWLDPIWAQKEVEAIRHALALRDPSHAETYAENAKRYIALLADLDSEYREGLRYCEFHTIVTSHQAFAYLAKRYGFETISISGISPEAEVSPRALAELAQTVRRLGLRYIFFETLASPKVAETLAQEAGAQTLVFNPLEGLTDEERQAGKGYLSIMRENLSNLRIALQCQE